MGAVYFYHLTSSSLEDSLPLLLQKSLQAELSVLVRAQDVAGLKRLDEVLWRDGFLPHGLEGGEFDEEQPILLAPESYASERFLSVMCILGASLPPEEVSKFKRASVMFNGHDPHELHLARLQWKALSGAGCEAQYWAQDGGRWVKKA